MSLRLFYVLGLVTFVFSARAQLGVPVSKPTRPIPAIEHVLIVSVDGLRPDRALLAEMPVLRGLLKTGAYTFWAKTTAVSITLPSHASMLTGVTPSKHGLEWNRDLPFSKEVYPKVPTLFELASRSGYTTALIAGKSKMAALNKPGTVTHSDIPPVNPKAAQQEEEESPGEIKPSDSKKNEVVAAKAAKIIEEHKPNVVFVHFPEVDTFGHRKGWGSREQLESIERTDTHLGTLVAALERAGMRQSTLIIISADHGGAARTHGADDARSRHIPWIVHGPGVRKFFDLTTIAALEVRTEDTCATACYVLGLPQSPKFDGKPVMEAFELDAAK